VLPHLDDSRLSLSKDPKRGAAPVKSSSVMLFPQQPGLQLMWRIPDSRD